MVTERLTEASMYNELTAHTVKSEYESNEVMEAVASRNCNEEGRKEGQKGIIAMDNL
jgi:hypothetical protein